jgi:hypothetical protein
MAKHRRTKQQRRHPKNPPRVAEAMGEKLLSSGTITLPPGAIPSPSGGRSSAVDFSDALMRGNPIATKAVDDALRRQPGLIPIPSLGPHAMGRPADEASVADKFVASTYNWCRYFNYTAKEEKLVTPILMAYRHAMRQANKFVLDKEFVEYATTISSTCKPEKLLARLPLATLPYETTWIEFDLHTKVRTMRRMHGQSDMPEEGNVAPRLGVLLERVNDTMATVTMVADGQRFNGITAPNLTGYIYSTDERTLRFDQMFHGLTPFDAAYRSDRLKGLAGFADVMNDPEAAPTLQRVTRGTLWGYAQGGSAIVERPRDMINNVRVPEFLERHGELAFTRFYDFFEVASKTRPTLMQPMSELITSEVTEFSGMMRWLVVVLAMLNEVPTRANFIQPMHTMRAGLTRRVPAFDFHRLTLRLPKTKAVPYLERKLRNVERRHKAHKVMAHWRTYLHVEHCLPDEHAWEYDEEHGYALCGKCMAFRRRIHEHVRGDPSLGWVNKEYLIKPAKQE